MQLRCKKSTAWLGVVLMLFSMSMACTQAASSDVNVKSKKRSAGVHVLGVSLDLSSLQLTEDQERKIKDARKFARLKLHELKQAKSEKVEQLKTLLFNPTTTESQIRNCGEEIQRFQASIDNVNLDSLIQLRAILTIEQRNKLANAGRNDMSVCIAAPTR
jgi:Spy/CpxP family protein refolding chaperone